MARVVKRLAGPLLLSTSPAGLYTTPEGRRTHIHSIRGFNGSDSQVLVTISIGPDEASTRIVDQVPVPARAALKTKGYRMTAGESIQAWASVGSEVTLTINGTEEYLSIETFVPQSTPTFHSQAARQMMMFGAGGVRKIKVGRVAEGEDEAAEFDPLSVWLGQTAGYAELATESGYANVLIGTPWTLESRYGTCDIVSISVYCGNAVGNCRLKVFADNSGQPGSILAETGSFALVSGWNTQALSGSLASGARYWLALNASDNAATFGARPGTQEGLTTERKSHTFGAGPSSFGTPDAGTFDWNLCIYLTLESQSVAQPTPTNPQVSPPTLTGGGSLSGYSLLFYDEFDYLNRQQWTNQVWWDGTGQPDCIYTDDGTLHLVAKQTDGYDLGGGNAFWPDGWPHVLIDTLGFKDDFREGYYEARMRDTGSRASFPAWWLFSTDWAKTSNCGAGDRAAELDVVELWGNQFPTHFSGTAHSDSANVCTANNQNPNSFQDISPTTTVGQWRTYGMLWTPTQLAWYVDNARIHTLTIGTGTDWETFDRDMHVILYQWPYRGVTIDGDTWPAPTNGVDPAEIHTEVDWVRVWEP